MGDSFLLLALAFIIGGSCALKVWNMSTQEGEIFDRIFNWQKHQREFGMKQGFLNELAHRAMGGCEFCYSYWGSVLSFIVFTVSAYFGIGIWFSVDSMIWQWVLNFIFFLAYVSVSNILTWILVTRL